MKKYTRNLLSVAAISLLSASAFATSLVGVSGTLKNIERPVNVSVQQAEKMFEENRGRRLASNYNLLTSETSDPYVRSLHILKDYRVVMKLADENPNPAGGLRVATPVAQALLGKIFIFVPVYGKGDEVITSWECITDADYNVQQFIGDSGARENSRSYISAATTNKYLTTCVYVKNISPYVDGVVHQKTNE